jgi:hypothetical protein
VQRRRPIRGRCGTERPVPLEASASPPGLPLSAIAGSLVGGGLQSWTRFVSGIDQLALPEQLLADFLRNLVENLKRPAHFAHVVLAMSLIVH